jgi:polysaccharide pyruvyl transferase WcaK-like protein
MKIVIQPSGMRCLNVGDQAMLEVAYRRLRSLWPHAEIAVFTLAPEEVRSKLPGAIPLSPEGRGECFEFRLFGRLSKPGFPLSGMFRGFEDAAFKHLPVVQGLVAQAKMRARGRHASAHVISIVQAADLFVFSGAGMITDAFAGEAKECLELMYLSKRFGARTAIVGHMFGPVEDLALKEVCRRVLPTVDLISVRERVASLPFLAACGVRREVRVTGDETLEFLTENRAAAESRNALGVNVRASYYSGVNGATASLLGAAVRKISGQFSARLEPLAVAHHAEDNDAATLRALDHGFASSVDSDEPETAIQLLRRVAACRVVITGSYHAAVFALAQGIPAIGLAFAPYYEAKFKGLQDLFGQGCRYINGTRRGWDEELQMVAADLWTNARYWENQLLQSARRQAASSRAAYNELYAIVEGASTPALVPVVQPVPSRAASESV